MLQYSLRLWLSFFCLSLIRALASPSATTTPKMHQHQRLIGTFLLQKQISPLKHLRIKVMCVLMCGSRRLFCGAEAEESLLRLGQKVRVGSTGSWNWWCGKIRVAAATVCMRVQRKSWCWLIKIKSTFSARRNSREAQREGASLLALWTDATANHGCSLNGVKSCKEFAFTLFTKTLKKLQRKRGQTVLIRLEAFVVTLMPPVGDLMHSENFKVKSEGADL